MRSVDGGNGCLVRCAALPVAMAGEFEKDL